ncbi:Lrp/AsnC family transcriptional regulator [Nocardiopsis sp. CNS-639]|uniref:Lrp/AsnC family transcriptional regulator n=1 Tax=Nocardiopsis sp. CNS-639 TaxID=1169153 RepID=UPI001E47EFF9|nr:Lrp/AsnC family transcriptional regulator [Nocardiopsis sp. CNS-639]
MTEVLAEANAVLDELDMDLVAALQSAPRAPVSALAEAVGSSASTVGRRLQRLQSERSVRVVGQVDWPLLSDAHPHHVWITTAPGHSRRVARRLAERPETQFTAVTSGGSDVYCVVHPFRRDRAADLLADGIPSVEGVAATRSDLVLRAVSRADSWRLDRLDPARSRALDPYTDTGENGAAEEPRGPLSAQEALVVRMLHRDARAGSGEVARALGVSQSTAYRLVQSVLERRMVRPRVEVEPALLGMGVEAVLALEVSPREIGGVADALGAHPSARYVSVVAGTSSVIHHAVFRDEAELADFLSADLGRLSGITGLRVSVVLDVLRRYWTAREGARLGPPGPSALLDGEPSAGE